MRSVISALAFAALLPVMSGAQAQTGSGKTMTIVVPYAAGGGYDRIARLVAPRLAETLNQSVVVENRGGAGGTLAMAAVAKAPADGSQLVVAGPGDIAIAPALYAKRIRYDTVADFEPIIAIAKFALALSVTPSLGVKDVGELIRLAKSREMPLRAAISSVGSTGHLSAEMFRTMTGISTINVPYKGTGPALTDLSGGHVDMMFTEPGSVMPFYKAGKVQILAVTTAERAKLLPAVPTLAESGFPGYAAGGWWGLFAPAGTPSAITGRIRDDVSSIMREPAFIAAIESLHAEISGVQGDALRQQIRDDIARFRKAVQDSGIKVE
jgi:tripartite-type tricarboxylate transporter receptor subunit TctC